MSDSVFISSTVYWLSDLRAVLFEKLKELGFDPYRSEEPGFEPEYGLPPYAACLCNIDKSIILLAIIDRWYGTAYDDWGQYTSICKGLSPTHGEITYALQKNILVWPYVRKRVQYDYDIWIANPHEYKAMIEKQNDSSLSDLRVLQMLDSLKKLKNPPFITQFEDVTNITQAINKRLWTIRDEGLVYKAFQQQTLQSSTDCVVEQIEEIGNIHPLQISSINQNENQIQYEGGTVLSVRASGSVVVINPGESEEEVSAVAKLRAKSNMKVHLTDT